MATVFGRQWTRVELLERVGDISQLCEAKPVTLTGGNRSGVEAVYIKTGSGLTFWVLPGRGMDIGAAEYKGSPLSWRSSTGEVHSAFFEPEGSGMDRNYHGGLMHISGLTYAGLPCTDEGKELGLHGRISNIPAQNVYIDSKWDGDDYEVWVQGKIRETSALGENVLLTRRVTARLGQSKIWIEDRVENLGHAPVEHMLLYHTNFGWPLLSEDSELVVPTCEISAMVPSMEKDIPEHMHFQPPTAGHGGVLFYHKLAADFDGNTKFALVNRHIQNGLGLCLKFSRRMLPNLVEWKMMGQGHYVLECGPSNCRVDGRNAERANGTLQFLQPFESRTYQLEFDMIAGQAEIERCIDEIRELQNIG